MMSLGGGPVVRAKWVDIFFLVDVSGSMLADAKIQSLNAAVEEALPALRRVGSEQVGVEVGVRVLTFGSEAVWLSDESQALDDFWWESVHAEEQGLTELGLALDKVLEVLDRGVGSPPALILLTDGMPTDTESPSFEDALAALDRHPIGGATPRVAVAIGIDADSDSLAAFAGSGAVLDARRPEEMVDVIRTAGTSVIASASTPVW